MFKILQEMDVILRSIFITSKFFALLYNIKFLLPDHFLDVILHTIQQGLYTHSLQLTNE